MVRYKCSPVSIKKYLQILRFQSLRYVLLTSQEEERLGGERQGAWQLKGRTRLAGNEKQKRQLLSKQK